MTVQQPTNEYNKEALAIVREALIAGKTISFPSGVEVREDEAIIHPALDAHRAHNTYGAVTPQQMIELRAELANQGLLPI